MGGSTTMPLCQGGRKSLDAAINLVPFIDLLSCCISFLLITAVWSQLAAVPVSHGDSGGDSGAPPDVELMLHVRQDGFFLQQSDREPLAINDRAEHSDLLQLAEALRSVKLAHPQKQDITVAAEDGVLYERVITTLDVLRSAQFPAIHVSER